MKRFIAAFAAALMLAVGVPGVASAAVSNYVFYTTCPGDVGVVFYNPGDEGPKSSMTISQVIAAFDGGPTVGDEFTIELGKTSAGGFCFEIAGDFTPFELTGTVSSELITELDEDGLWENSTANDLGIVIGTTLYAFVGADDSISGSALSYVTFSGSDIGGGSGDAPAADPLTTSTPITKRNGISFTPDNFDPSCAYEISTSAGTVKQNPVTGEVNVYGVGSGTSVSVTITDCTGATTTVSGKATAATAAVQTLTKPTVASSAELITCSAGTSTVNPSSIAYTLLVDGVAVSTRFSDGAIAPSLVATTAAQNLYSGATLSKASWSIDPTWAGKSYSCTTTSYADGAVGVANS